MTTTIHLVRHAMHDLVDRVLVGRKDGIRIGETGRRQAAELAERFGRGRILAVQSSPRERARETAEPIAAANGLPVDITGALDEIDYGAWTGRSLEELAGDPEWYGWNEARGATRPPGGESMRELQDRIVRHLEEVRQERSKGAIVMVTHAEVIRAALLHYLARPLDLFWQISVAPAAIATIEASRSGVEVTWFHHGVGR